MDAMAEVMYLCSGFKRQTANAPLADIYMWTGMDAGMIGVPRMENIMTAMIPPV